jgi:menaquinone-dependent protoporphyrinogen oxidase
MKLLLVYGSTEGHTRTITESMAATATEMGVEADVFDSANFIEPLQHWRWNVAIIGGSVHQGHHQTSLRNFVLANSTRLNSLPSAFFSVSLSAAVKDDSHQQEACLCATTFVQEVGWKPLEIACFAGAIKNAEYDYFKRMVLSLLARQLEPGIITAHDVVYTDWMQVETFTKNFLERSKNLLAVRAS